MISCYRVVLGYAVLVLLVVGVRGSVSDPDGYYRVAYDNCGVAGQQNHVRVGSSYAYLLKDVDAQVVAEDAAARTVVFDAKQVVLSYEGLPVEAAYRLVLTLLSDGPRCQTIYVNDTPVEAKLELKKGRVYRLKYDLPKSVYSKGRLDVRIACESGPNAVVSEAVLYSTARRLKPVLRMAATGNLNRQIRGRIVDLNQNTPVANVSVTVDVGDTGLHLDTETDQAGEFCLTVPATWRRAAENGLHVQARLDSLTLKQNVDVIELFPPQLIPRPAQTGGVQQPILSLVGTWKFTPVAPEDFPASIGTANDAADINVPGEWVMQGFEVPQGQAAGYFRNFDVPADFQGHRIILHCDAVYAEAEIWINGDRVGAHAGGMTAFQLDVTDQVQPGGRNTIAMKVVNETQADVLASGSQYAVHPLGGITRKLYLQAIPQTAITTLDVSTVFDAAYRDADIHVALAVENAGARVFDRGHVRFSLYDETGQRVELSDSKVPLAPLAAGEDRRLQVTLPVSEPRKWDPEHPHLYHLEGTLYANDGAVEVVRRRFGFRQIEVRGDRVFVNNHPIKLRGVNRHEVHPLRGRSLTPQQWRRDAELFRAANVNYIRTSHYPPAEEFLDYCDELGLFVECEAPLCWVQHGANANWGTSGWNYLDPNLYVPLLRANLENVAFNRRHPSIIIWSLANESRWSPLWAKVLEAVEYYDPTRPTSFHDQCYGGYNNAGSTARIANMHYPGPRGPEQAAGQERPLLFGEYCHLNAYNRYELVTDPGLREAWGRGFKAMWDKIYQTPGCLGGALWSGIDDTFYLPSGHTVGYGTWGPIDGWRRPKPEYYHLKKTYSPVRITVSHLETPNPGDALVIPVENRHDFSNLQELKILWRVGNKAGYTQADIRPHQAGQFLIKSGLTQLEGCVLDLEFVHPDRGVVDEYSLPIGRKSSQENPEIASEPADRSLTLMNQDDAIVVQGETFAYEINRRSGQIVRAEFNGVSTLVGGPELLVLPLNAEGGTQMTKEAQEFSPFTAVCSGRTVERVAAQQGDGRIVVEVSDKYAQAQGGYRLIVESQGRLTLEYSYEMLQEINPRQWGMVMTVPKELDTLSWRRRGLWTLYPNDHIGRLRGTTRAFVGSERCGPSGPRIRPDYAWSLDSSRLGTNDFRSTKETIYQATLTNNMNFGVSVLSEGSQHVRTWVDDQYISLLVAEYSNAGAERFFRSHAAIEDKPLKVGDTIKGSIHLELGPAHQ